MAIETSYKKPFVRLWELLRLDKDDILSLYSYAILSGLVQLSVPIGIQSIISFVLGAQMVTSIYVLIVLVLIGVLIIGVLQINQMKIIEKIMQKIFVRNSMKFLEVIPSYDLVEVNSHYIPEKINRFFDTISIQKGFSKILLEMPSAIIQIIFGLLLLAFYNTTFIVFGIIILFFLLMAINLTSARGLRTSIIESNYKYETVGWLQEVARTIITFKFFKANKFESIHADDIIVNYLEARTRHFKLLVSQYKVLIFFKFLITAMLLSLGVYLLMEQQLNLGEFIAAEIVILTIINATENIIKSLDSVYDVITGLEKIASAIEQKLDKNDGKFTELTATNISLKDFGFCFSKDSYIFEDVNVDIPDKSIVAITGAEGVGKSTLLKVLSGIYGKYEGTYSLGNIPFENYDIDFLRSKMGVMLHKNEVFKGSVIENIKVGRAHITINDILDLSRIIGITDFFNKLPLGLNTIIDPSGNNLSSTLISKILLLRALVDNPLYIILEEPWINLEEQNALHIINYLASLRSKTTIVVVADHPYFLQSADYILSIKDKKILSQKNS